MMRVDVVSVEKALSGRSMSRRAVDALIVGFIGMPFRSCVDAGGEESGVNFGDLCRIDPRRHALPAIGNGSRGISKALFLYCLYYVDRSGIEPLTS